jgi:signal transduction histidine kinase
MVLGGVLLTLSVARWRHPRVDPRSSLDAGLYAALAAAVVLVAATWAYGPLLDRWTRRGVAHLVSGLGSAAAAGTVARVIAAATGDPSVQLVYRLPSSGGYADADGCPVDPPGPGPGALPVLRDGQELAVVLHDPVTTSSDSVRATIGTALMLALDNERLRAEGLAQLADLRASRARVVQTGDAERRQLERNLHDGAQQQMLALSFDLRRAVACARAPEAREVLASAEAEARTALAELRDLAHGIHPAILEEAGLGPALATLADGAPVPVEVCEELGVRLPPSVERTAYVVVRDAVTIAAAIGSQDVKVTLTEDAGDLVVEVLGAGPGPFLPIEDRVAGAGGQVVVEPDRLRAVIPCEW